MNKTINGYELNLGHFHGQIIDLITHNIITLDGQYSREVAKAIAAMEAKGASQLNIALYIGEIVNS